MAEIKRRQIAYRADGLDLRRLSRWQSRTEKGAGRSANRDLDQMVIGNPAHDLVRLGLSLASAARGSDLPGVTTAQILEQLISGYEEALAGDFGELKAKGHRPAVVQSVLEHAARRRWRHLAEERIEDVEPSIPLGKHFWSLTKPERQALRELFENEDVRRMVTSLDGRDDDRIEMLDAAYWIKGCSSLGRLRYAVLLGIGKGKTGPQKMCLIDIKEGVKTAPPRGAGGSMPRDNAARVVAGARALSPNLGDRMMATRLLDKSVVLRELMPQDLRDMRQRNPTRLPRGI